MTEQQNEARVTGAEIISEILRNMCEGQEPLHYTTLVPGIYRVYLHPDDFDRLRVIVPRIIQEAKRALDEELKRLNKAPRLRKPDKTFAGAEQGWQIEFHEDPNQELAKGEIEIHSELALPARSDYGAGAITRRIETRRSAGQLTTSRAVDDAETHRVSERVYANIRFEDNRGRQSYEVTKHQVVVGRGGRDYWVDLALHTVPDVSREHIRLRRDENTGAFFIKDLSKLGTTVNGKPIPSSIEIVDGNARDKNIEVPLPAKARIGLAGIVFLDFEALGQK